MDIFIYLAMILVVAGMLYAALTTSIDFCPVKIKEVMTITLTLMIFRVGSLWALLVIDSVKLIYILRNFVFLNIIYIPLIMFITLYIFYRNTKINLQWFYYIFLAATACYIICIFLIPMEYYISPSYGYNVVLSSDIPYKILLCISGFIFFAGMQAVRYKYSVKWGIILIEVMSLLFLATTAMALKSTENIGLLLLGELGWMIVLYSSVITFRINGIGK